MPVIDQMDVAKKFLRNRLVTDNATLFGYLSERHQIKELISRTLNHGESNSAVIIGPKGCGKTTLVASVLFEMLPDDIFATNGMIVHLNGFIQTDDGAALKSITKQLNLETAVGGKVFTAFADNLAFLLDCLKSGDKKHSKSVVFILEEFDLFCSHGNQTLIYNLFDVAQSAQAPICVIGLTRRNDVIELLEKRVKSRFSHRQIFLYPQQFESDSVDSPFVQLLKLPTKHDFKQCALRSDIKLHPALNFLKYNFNLLSFAKQFDDAFVKTWNQHINTVALDTKVKEGLENICDINKSVAVLKNILFQVVANIPEQTTAASAIDVTAIQKCIDVFIEYDDKIGILCSLSVLEISLIIAMKHHSEIYDHDPFNFEIILTRLNKFQNAANYKENYDRELVLKAFDVLSNTGLIVPVSLSSKGQKEYQMHQLLVTYNQIQTAVKNYKNLPTNISQWARSSLL